MQVTNCYKAKDVRKWSATPNSCMIIGYELFASLTAPVVHKAKKRQLAAAAAVEQQLAGECMQACMRFAFQKSRIVDDLQVITVL